ncbi:MAG: hypothetical protein PHV78_01735 [Patescibacteria group bacterium]|nr:hypothetical protein [Patescibacteria group bacterium]MDD5121128.1 hypothetical protein [Patescibacteria group bacterium]MDD5221643.1 hypothetical protein [Patescibacteria group bacterium]MDD5395953.1 hypothetical protein [Patescibacteria group bacterium]
MYTEQQIIENLKKCPYFNRCSQNLCPLDLELHLRTGNKQDKCRWMREPKQARVEGKEFISGGGVMPNVLLNFVPEANLEWLNQSSQEACRRLIDPDSHLVSGK